MADPALTGRDRDRVVAGGAIVAGLAVAAVVVVPLVELVAAAVERGWDDVTATFRHGGAARAAWNTLWTAAVVTPVAVVVGTAAAVVTERTRAPAPRALRVAVVGSLLVPSFVAAESWARAYAAYGLLDDAVGLALPRTYGAVGVVLVIAVHAVPLVYLIVAASLRAGAEPDLERAARAAGAGGGVVLRTIVLPILRPALVAAAALAFVTGVNAFGIPAVLGLPADFVTLTTRIYRDLAFSADPSAFHRVVVASLGLVLLAAVAVAVGDAATSLRAPATRTPGGSAGEPTLLTRSRWPGVALWLFVVVADAIPLVALLLTALTPAVGVTPTPENWTLANLEEALSLRTIGALRNSSVLAVTAATAAVVLGAILAAVGRRRSGRLLGTATIATFAVPGSALAVAVLLAYGGLLRDTLALILIAYVAKFWAFGHRTLAGSIDSTPPDLARAARASGAGAVATLRTIVVPLLRPAFVAAWVLVFVTAVQELTMSVLLYGPGTATLAVVVLNAQQLGDVPVTAALAVLLTALVAAAALPLLVWRGRSAPTS